MPSDGESRGGLGDSPFAYRAVGGARVFISWRGREVRTLRGREAESFLRRVMDLDARGQQVLMAKVTGNFKRGNER